ncbi:MAG: ribosomal RNA small subunit methyltransferase A [Verrucomicrobiales bacterium]|nr:ribosomal RNA small subunit methyltransferase A [Verrucomicrobiales bacterium]
MKLSEIRNILSEQEIQLTRSLGQNFMHDGNQIRKIVEAAAVCKEDAVVEIGPGLGPLTEKLLDAAGKVIAIETDRRLVSVLGKRFEAQEHFQLVHADALQVIRKEASDWTQWKLVANMPYSVASPVLVELAKKDTGPRWITTTLQLEVGQRLVAKPSSKTYGVLTLLVQLAYEPRLDFVIPRGCFFPEPKIDSACVSMERRQVSLLEKERVPVFEKIVKRGFSQRRKMMLKLLKQDWDPGKLERAYSAAGIDVKVRAEAVSLDQFIVMTNTLSE